MKYPKLFSLAALAALATMAVVASSASANAKVCSTAGTGEACGGTHGKVYTGPVVAKLTTGKTAKLTSGFITVNCTSSEVKGNITNGLTGTGNIEALTFGGCTSGLGACTASTKASSTTKWSATANAATNTLVVTHSPITGEFTCAGILCKYQTNSASTTVDESTWNGTVHSTAEVTALGVALTLDSGSSGFCSPNATWTADYQITTPDNLYLT